jgi:molybdopterin-binding protein
MSMKISGRNKLKGKIIEVQLGDIMALVTVQVGENLVDAVITRKSAEELKLQAGDEVAALIKATEVMILKDSK